jgi:hypothetical protein
MRQVIIAEFIYRLAREPVWLEYQITCMVYSNPMQGNLAASLVSSVDDLVGADLGAALATIGL